ncbi:MAG: hypothetical protein E7Z91_07110 [Cyanobacteria bacterium SIG30]|nr:hypothetical protein [Cyanobacteria bacterium SIG30]
MSLIQNIFSSSASKKVDLNSEVKQSSLTSTDNCAFPTTNEDDLTGLDEFSYSETRARYNLLIMKQEQQIQQLEREKDRLQAQLYKAEDEQRDAIKGQIKNIGDSIDACYDQINDYLTAIISINNVEATENVSATSSTSSTSKTSLKTASSSSKTSKGESTLKDANFDTMLGHVLGYEGGFSNHPADRGGATNYGITQGTYTSYKGKYVDVRNITKEEVYDIYYKNYYVASGASKIAKTDPDLAFAVFDAAVNHGVGYAKSALAKCGNNVDTFMELRKQKYISIVANNPSQKVFEKGWQNRWNRVYSVIDSNHKYVNYIG